MTTATRVAADLPSQETMMTAFLEGDAAFDGVFVTGVRTTGIFCRPSCTARKPLPKNVEFFPSHSAALHSGYRPCKRCRPMDPPAGTPDWIRALMRDVEADPQRRWRDTDLRARDLAPERVRRWFRANHGMTFHAYARGIRLGQALGKIGRGDSSVTHAAMDAGFDSLSGFADAARRATGASPRAAGADDIIHFQRIDTPLGPMIAGAVDAGLCLLEFADRRALETQLDVLARRLGRPLVPGGHPWLAQIETELGEYFADDRRRFDVPLVIEGTPFQEEVWRALLTIDYGETRSYAEMAAQVGRPNAVRALGTANGANRLAIVIPCHRVIGANGALSGYGGGVWRKQRLLDLERGGFGF
ncbi:MAG: methylated-DNA--[protein]-cysteine S-methyltransferase [Pseudomonadota bacterium]